MRVAELSTSMICLRDGTTSDSMALPDSMSGKICFRRETFSLGGLYATFVSAPIMR